MADGAALHGAPAHTGSAAAAAAAAATATAAAAAAAAAADGSARVPAAGYSTPARSSARGIPLAASAGGGGGGGAAGSGGAAGGGGAGMVPFGSPGVGGSVTVRGPKGVGSWTKEEDDRLNALVEAFGVKWSQVIFNGVAKEEQPRP